MNNWYSLLPLDAELSSLCSSWTLYGLESYFWLLLKVIIFFFICCVTFYFIVNLKMILNQLHAVSCTHQGRQRELVLRQVAPNSECIACWVAELNAALWNDTRVKRREENIYLKLIFPFSTIKWKISIYYISFPRLGIEPTTSRVYNPCATTLFYC